MAQPLSVVCKLKKNIRILLALGIISIVPCITGNVFACGGPATYNLDMPMHSLDSLVEALLSDESDYEIVTRDEFLFLYPFKLQLHNDQEQSDIESLWALAYRGDERLFGRPATDAFESALKRGDWRAAEPQAKRIINDVLDMPSVVADKYQAPLIEALEFLELQPYLTNTDPRTIAAAFWDSSIAADRSKLPPALLDVLEMRNLDRERVDEIISAKPKHPRMATLRFISLRNRFAREVPNGWVYDIRKKVPKETWRGLEESTNLWLKDYPDHPLADLVLLWKTRIYYFEGDRQQAWKLLISMYPRRQARVLYEMRFMLMNFSVPQDETVDAIKDPILFSAFLPSVKISPEKWAAWWKISEENYSRPWARNLQERLLAKAVKQEGSLKLPPSFPKAPRNPTPLWGELRALALMKTCNWEDAGKQLFSLAPDKDQAVLAAAYHLRRGKAAMAAQVIDLPADIRHYLIRVTVDYEDLQSLTTAKNPNIKREALFEQGVRLAEKGKWSEAAKMVLAADSDKGALWKKAASFSTDTSASGIIAWARFLKENNGTLFYGNDSAWYRTLSWRTRHLSQNRERIVKRAKGEPRTSRGAQEETYTCSQKLPWTPEHEEEAITQHFFRTTEMWLALQAYAAWLSTAKPSKEMTAAVKEADLCYNWLVNWDSGNSGFWREYLIDHPVVTQIREAGKRARKY